MEIYIKSYDMKVWKVIKLDDIPIPPTKTDDKKEDGSIIILPNESRKLCS